MPRLGETKNSETLRLHFTLKSLKSKRANHPPCVGHKTSSMEQKRQFRLSSYQELISKSASEDG